MKAKNRLSLGEFRCDVAVFAFFIKLFLHSGFLEYRNCGLLSESFHFRRKRRRAAVREEERWLYITNSIRNNVNLRFEN